MASLKHNIQTVVTATPAKVGETEQRVLWGVSFYCLADGICRLNNAATDAGDVLLTLHGTAKTTVFVDLTQLGGMVFSTALFATLTGTGNIAYFWYD